MTKRQTKTYTEEFKQSSAKLAVESKQPVPQIASELGVRSSTLYSWINKYASVVRRGSNCSVEAIQEENKRLRKELTRAQQERDILKKATAYFAREAR